MITIHPAMFDHPDWQNAIGQLEASTGLTAVAGQRFATLQPVAETPRNATATQEQQA